MKSTIPLQHQKHAVQQGIGKIYRDTLKKVLVTSYHPFLGKKRQMLQGFYIIPTRIRIYGHVGSVLEAELTYACTSKIGPFNRTIVTWNWNRSDVAVTALC